MRIVDYLKNYINVVVGRNQEFEELLKNEDISRIQSQMTTRKDEAIEAWKEYEVATHDIMNREDKIITNKKGEFVRKEKVWKLPIPYQQYINEISLVFLYGRPVKWINQSEGTDEAFAKFQDVIKRTRFNSKIRQCKRISGAETESALLFRVFKDSDGNPDVQIRVLANSKGDEIYVRKDQYENIISIAWGYYIREENENIVYHFDIFTKKVIYRCTKKNLGWEVLQEENFIGKIPIILFQQDKEWKGVENLIFREEFVASKTADTNDYFSDPIAVAHADVIKNLPEKKDANKMLVVTGETDINNAFKYLTWDNAPQSKKEELEWLHNQILSKTFTPDITLDTLKSMSSMSGKALRTVLMLADIKANKHKELHDELLDRTASLITAIIGNVLNISLKTQCEALKVTHEYQEPFGEDISEAIQNIISGHDGGILSQETSIELNPLVKDKQIELMRLEKEAQEQAASQMSLFTNDNDDEPGTATTKKGNSED